MARFFFGITTDNGRETITEAIEKGDINKVKQLIQLNASNLNIKNQNGETPLIFACIKNQSDIALLLINNGANVNVTDKNGYTPLHYAAKYGLIKVVEALLNATANIHAESDSLKYTPLHLGIKTTSLHFPFFTFFFIHIEQMMINFYHIASLISNKCIYSIYYFK